MKNESRIFLLPSSQSFIILKKMEKVLNVFKICSRFAIKLNKNSMNTQNLSGKNFFFPSFARFILKNSVTPKQSSASQAATNRCWLQTDWSKAEILKIDNKKDKLDVKVY